MYIVKYSPFQIISCKGEFNNHQNVLAYYIEKIPIGTAMERRMLEKWNV